MRRHRKKGHRKSSISIRLRRAKAKVARLTKLSHHGRRKHHSKTRYLHRGRR